MYRLILTVREPQKIVAALTRAKIPFEVVSQKAVTGARVSGDAQRAQAIYDLAASGLTYGEVAEQFGVNYHTVLRVANNPAGYGVKGKPIRRIVRGGN